jgi:hypothetical protein
LMHGLDQPGFTRTAGGLRINDLGTGTPLRHGFADEQRNKRVTEDINSRITLLNADREVQVMEIDHHRNMRISREKFLTEKEEKTFKLLSM